MKTMLSLFFVFVLAMPAWAQDGVSLTYQGQLDNAAGEAVSASHPMTFRLYTVVSGGEAVWTEVHGSVDVVDGTFTVDLGTSTALGVALSDEPALFMGIQVGDTAEMAPRIRVGGALKAQWARVADHARDVRGEDIHPATVSIGETEVINADGQWVGDPTGLIGATGERGPAGVQGEPGPAGRQGDPGPAGSQGPLGDRGPEGPQGAEGVAGPVGPAPDLGADGDLDGVADWIELAMGTDPTDGADVPGDANADGIPDALVGPAGEQGEQGIQGEAGEQGIQGEPGEQGGPGQRGEQGFQGERGEAGVKGDPGIQGIQGQAGPAGRQGDPGPAGEPGAKGDSGEQGVQGIAGEAGPPGVQGDPGPAGIQGIQGEAGRDGAQGEPGIQGPPGNSVNMRLDSDGDGYVDWIEIALSTDPDDGEAQPTDDNLNGIADAFEAGQAAVGGGGGGDGPVLPGMPEGDVLYDSFTVNNIVDLTVIQQYRVIEGRLTINNTQLTRISLPNLQTVGYISIQDNALLTRVELPRLATVTGYVHVEDNARLPSFSLPSVTSVGEYFRIHNNDALTTLGGGFPGLTDVGDYFYIYENDALTTLGGGFPVLTDVGDYFQFSYNRALTTLGGSFPALTDVAGYLHIVGNSRLTTLDSAFPALNHVGGSVYIDSNGALTTLGDGFSALTNVSDYLRIHRNASLLEVSFPSLTSIGDYLTIGGSNNNYRNESLRHISFPALTTIGGTNLYQGYSVYIRYNPRLPNCLAQYYADNENVTRENGRSSYTGNNRNECDCAMVDGEMRATCPDD